MLGNESSRQSMVSVPHCAESLGWVAVSSRDHRSGFHRLERASGGTERCSALAAWNP
jgi:hypothetical protein